MITFEYDREQGAVSRLAQDRDAQHDGEAEEGSILPQADDDDESPLDWRRRVKTWPRGWLPSSTSSCWSSPGSECGDRVQPHTWGAYVATAEEWRKPAEVARELGMKVGTVFQAKHSVIALLKREIENLQGPA